MKIPKFKNIKVNAYKPGKATINRIKNIIKLSANESALGPSPKAKKEYIKVSKSFYASASRRTAPQAIE